MLDHPVCADTAGRFLMTGLRDGSVNINNLMVRACVRACSRCLLCYADQYLSFSSFNNVIYFTVCHGFNADRCPSDACDTQHRHSEE